MRDRILHVAKYYYPDEGGIETVTKYLVEGLTDFENIVICYSNSGKTTEELIAGVRVYRISPSFQIARQDVAFSYFKHTRKIINDFNPNIIIVHCPNPFVYPIIQHIADNTVKIVLLWHSDILNKGFLYKMIKPIEQSLLKRADLILATSPNYVHPSSPIYRFKDKIEIVPNGVIASNLELKDGDLDKIKEIRSTYNNKPLILFVGRHTTYKGIEYLIEAERFIKSDCHIVIAGRGSLTEKLKRMSKSNRITFLGKISDENLRLYYHAATIFGFTSITKQEAFGVALAEAMYCYCIPVTFRIEGSGVNWLSKDGQTGIVVKLKDTAGYANAIDRILSDKTLMKQYAQASHDRVNMFFTSQVVVKKADEVLKNLIKSV